MVGEFQARFPFSSNLVPDDTKWLILQFVLLMSMFSEFQFVVLMSSIFIQWLPELQHYAPGVPIVLAGTKLGELCDNDIFPNFICVK